MQRNHGVAAPVAETVIASDDAAAVGLFRKAALNDELIGSENELPKPRGGFFSKFFVFRLPFLEKPHIVIGTLRPSGFAIERGRRFCGRHECYAGTNFKPCAEQSREKTIFPVIQAPLGLFTEVAAEVPIVARLTGRCTTFQIKRSCAVECQHFYAILD